MTILQSRKTELSRVHVPKVTARRGRAEMGTPRWVTENQPSPLRPTEPSAPHPVFLVRRGLPLWGKQNVRGISLRTLLRSCLPAQPNPQQEAEQAQGGRRKTTRKKLPASGAWGAQWVKPLPSAQVMIPQSWDRVPLRAPCSVESLFLSLPLPATLLACAHSL